ncbi:MAG: alanine--tRNA ligase [Oscillospiraceae bacterium]|nr:alanine--tRNA ligase [Oscillospiraceae bacterium]
MKKFTSKELRNTWKQFYLERGHKDVGAVSLVSDGATGVLFNVAGMQPLMPYLLGQEHPLGKRLCNVQGCVRTNDIDSVGDESHVTFFEMMGSWSLGDYFKKERTQWSFELLTQVFGFQPEQLAATVFEGNEKAPRDEETAKYRIESGFLPENIYYLPEEDNWWGLESGPCGPDSEMFFINPDMPKCSPECRPGCSCGKYTELGNDVFMQYSKSEDGVITQLEKKNVDTGWGLERNLAFLNGEKDVYRTDVFASAIAFIEEASGLTYGTDKEQTKAMRIVADHVRTSVMLIGDEAKLTPSNVGAGYILRRLIRRAVRYARSLNLSTENLKNLCLVYINEVYAEAYPLLVTQTDFILNEFTKECSRFSDTLEKGMKEFKKIITRKEQNQEKQIEGDVAFHLYDTFGFPIELTVEMAEELGYSVDTEGFRTAFKEHQDKSRAIEKNVLKSGLENDSEGTIKHHTATHLLNAALKKVLNPDTHQKGSKVSEDQLRFDFNCDHKLTDEEISQIETLINSWIQQDMPVSFESVEKMKAVEMGAEHEFIEKYPDIVKVYTIGDVSKEICTGPHVNSTSELGSFKILKEKSSSRGIRRIVASVQ